MTISKTSPEYIDNSDFIQLLYMAYYCRPADPEGLEFWVKSSSVNTNHLVQSFGVSQEFEDNYGTLSNSDLVTKLYQELFGHAPDSEGLNFYVDLLVKGEATLLDITIRIIDGVQQGSNDALVMDNRLTVANAITNMLSDLGPEKAAKYNYDDGPGDRLAIDNYFSTITFDTTTRDDHLTQDALIDLMIALGVLPEPIIPNEPDTEPPILSISGNITVTIVENSPVQTVIYDAQAADDGGQIDENISYSLGGTDALSFTINQDNGIVNFVSSPDYETQENYSIEVIATDANGNASSQVVTVSVEDEDEIAPVFYSGTFEQHAENLPRWNPAYNAQAVDNNGSVDEGITYTLPALKLDNALFWINKQGAVYFKNIPDYENPLDNDEDNIYTILIEASDESGNTAENIVNIKIIDVDDLPSPPDDPLINLYHPPNTQFEEDDLYSPIQYEWNSVENTLTASTQMGSNIQSVVITDENGTVITTGITSGQTGSITLDLQSAYDGGDDSFEQIENFDMNKYFAYITKTAYTFTFTDANGIVVEESYSLIVNKGLNLPRGITSQSEREMILMGERSGKDGVDIATAGENSANRDAWLETNNSGIEGDRFYAETVKDWGGKPQWVTNGGIGSYAEGSNANQLYLSFNRGVPGSSQVIMVFPDDASDESIINYYSNNDFLGSLTAIQFWSVSLGMNNSDFSIIIGSNSRDRIETYGNKFIAYGMGGNDLFLGDVGDSIILGGTGTDTYNFRYDTYNTSGHIYLDLKQLSEQFDPDNVSLGFFAAAELTDETETVLAIDYLQDIEIIIGSPADDYFYGDDGDNFIYGVSGDDSIEGEGGNDYLVGGAGSDSIEGGAGNDIIYGEYDNNSSGTDSNTLSGDEGDDIIYGGNGSDDIYGDDDNDILYGGNGDDFVFGDDGDDILYGGEGSDFMRGGEDDDILIPGPGPDSIYGDAGNDIIVFHNITSSTILNSVYGFKSNKDSIQLSVEYSTLPIQKIFDDTNGFDAETMEYFLSDPNYDGNNSDMINGPIDSNSFLLVSDGTHTTFFLVTNDSDAHIDSTEINEIIWFHLIDDVNFLDNNVVYSNDYQLIG